MRGENGGIGDQTEMSGNGMEKLSQGAEFKDSGKRTGTLALYVDEMYGKYVEGAAEVTKAEAQLQTQNGTDTEATGTDISSWVSYEDGEVKFTLADAASYRSKGASKATPGFDVMDYGQETYEFGSLTQDARHFDKYVLKVL